MVESVYKSNKNYYPQAFLEECKYKIIEKEIKSFIEDDLESSDESEEKKFSWIYNEILVILCKGQIFKFSIYKIKRTRVV